MTPQTTEKTNGPDNSIFIMFLILALVLLIIGWSHQSQLTDLQRRIATLEQKH